MGVVEHVAGNGYLSFVAKCVSNPVSCAALGESDPLWNSDPAVLLCRLTLTAPVSRELVKIQQGELLAG